jgi:hypothetical protein
MSATSANTSATPITLPKMIASGTGVGGGVVVVVVNGKVVVVAGVVVVTTVGQNCLCNMGAK